MILEFLSSGLLGFWLRTPSPTPPTPRSLSQIFLQPTDPKRDRLIAAYLRDLKQQGMAEQQQGLWIQTEDTLLVNHRGSSRQTPASLTKIATTLAVLKTWQPSHRFKTEVWTTGSLRNGILDGDLHLQSEGDPLFVTPEAIALAQQLNGLGIRKVTGNLILSGPVMFNFEEDPQRAGEQLRTTWQSAGKGSVAIAGAVIREENPMDRPGQPLVSHLSLPILDMLKMMNVYSHNLLADWFATQVGGASQIQAITLQSGRIAPSEIQLTNGSGLGQDNQLSPRAVVGLLQAVQEILQAHSHTLADLFPVMTQDKGTVEKRQMPPGAIVKTGTLWNTSGLAGMIQTQQQGAVWFAIMNRGDDFTEGFRDRQDRLLNALSNHWQRPSQFTTERPSGNPTDEQRRKRIHAFMQADFLSR